MNKKQTAIISIALGGASFIAPALTAVLARSFLLPVYAPRAGGRSHLLFGGIVLAGAVADLWINGRNPSSLLFNHLGVGNS